ncbi:MAG: 50S ribosomal protein L9 [Acidobacteriota bacterium]|jgi:large subunit ribosomal protein L9
MAVEVILREHVDHLGRRGEIVKVAPGYARNYLLPRGLALAVTESNRRQIELEKQRAAKRDAEERAEAEALKARIEAVELTIARRVGESETLYGSVTSSDIAEALAERELTVDRRRIQLDGPIKTLGEFTVPVRLTHDVTADIRVRVVALDDGQSVAAAAEAGPEAAAESDTDTPAEG